MNIDIKYINEILSFKEDADYKRLSFDSILVLRDYITNLQKENDRHFKEAIRYENACDELEIRIDKAIEYINDDLKDYNTISSGSANELLNILQGSDKE